MTLAEINPCARFARIHRKELGREYIVGLDHRAFYCIGGRGTIVIEETEYKMQKGAFLMIRAGVPYKGGATLDKMELYAVNFDMLSDSETSKDPIP